MRKMILVTALVAGVVAAGPAAADREAREMKSALAFMVNAAGNLCGQVTEVLPLGGREFIVECEPTVRSAAAGERPQTWLIDLSGSYPRVEAY